MSDIVPKRINEVIIYTDGSCIRNPGPGGWCAVLQLVGSEQTKTIRGGERYTTNNRMELTAVIRALELLKKPCVVHIYTDSEYVTNPFNLGWIEKWVKNYGKNAKGDEIKNWGMWLHLYDVVKKHKISFHHVPGHKGVSNNEYCDKIAREQALLYS